MGFFGENAKTGKDFPVADGGAYTCRFKGIEKTEFPSFNDQNIMEPKFRFEFETTEAVDDEDGSPFRFTKLTGIQYGFEGAGLTQLIDGMIGRHLEDSEFTALDISDLKKTTYKIVVTEGPNKKGRVVNAIVSVKPLKAKARAEAVPAADAEGDDTDNDPFA